MTHEFKSLCEAFETLAAKLDARLTRMEERMGISAGQNPPVADHPELPLENEDTRPRLVPVIGGKYRTRQGDEVEIADEGHPSGLLTGTTRVGPFYYEPDGSYSPEICVPQWDLVEVLFAPEF